MNVTQEKINLNSADLRELQQVPGIGEVMAERIIQARPFATLDDLKNVSGIGPAALEKILPFLTIASEPALALPESTQIEEPAQADEPSPEIVESLDGEPQTITPPTEDTPAQPEDSLPGITPDTIEEGTSTANKETPPISPPPQPTSQRDVRATRSQVIWTAFGFSLLAVVFALIISLGLLVLINGGLSYARPVQLSNLNHQVGNLTTQLANLEQNLESLNTRIDNLEGLSGRIKQIETTNQQLQEEVNTASESVRSLETQISEIEDEINNLKQATSRFQNFLDGLKELLTPDESP